MLAPCHLPADRIDRLDLLGIGSATAHHLQDVLEERTALRGLRQEVDRAREIDLRQVGLILDHDSATLDLTRQSDHLGVTVLAKYNHLTATRLHLLIGTFDLALQSRHHGARGVDHLDAQLLGTCVGRRGLAVSANEQSTTTQMLHILVRNSLQTKLFQALHLDTIMHDVAQRIDRTALRQSLLSPRNGAHHTETKTRIIVDQYLHSIQN